MKTKVSRDHLNICFGMESDPGRKGQSEPGGTRSRTGSKQQASIMPSLDQQQLNNHRQAVQAGVAAQTTSSKHQSSSSYRCISRQYKEQNGAENYTTTKTLLEGSVDTSIHNRG